ncbi:MAG: pyruvate kinase [Candidatus Moranbacteria bacterium RIFCSPHIGHO2_01_FULL_55_24]|nr:MAG: pyruvate kinase [Candidatus Moranbacteria bacterium RIFCSPHIGHO2_01_FULL_55_24]
MQGKKQTKIVATIGPASESKAMLRALVNAGMNVVRLNFSHGEHAWHQEVINRVRELSLELKTPIAILADLQGPRIRTEIAAPLELEQGAKVTVSDISHKESLEGENIVFLDIPGIIDHVEVGHALLIEDGTLELTVTAKEEKSLTAETKSPGTIKTRKGVILPDSEITLPIISEKDKRDLEFILGEGVEYIALSFVGSAEDIATVRAQMKAYASDEARLPKIVSKIERKEAIRNLQSIIAATDAVMVARGDLGIEMPESEIALLQKKIIRESLKAAKPVIVATQMMKSMTENPRPTRAEVSDVSNAVIDHTDAVMLSEESAMGRYPVETVAMMSEIIQKTEESPFDDLYHALDLNFKNEYSTMIRSVYQLAQSFRTKAILILSISGFTARLLSHFRPESRLLVATNDRRVWNELALVWGIDPYLFEGDERYDTHTTLLMEEAKKDGKISAGDRVAVFLGRTPEHGTMQLVGIKEVR